MTPYGGCDSAGGFGCPSETAVPETQRGILNAEISTVHAAWPSTRIALVGHSYGGMLAEQWWLLDRPKSPDHDGVVAVYSLDSPINGIRNALAAVPYSPEIQDLWFDLWNNLFTNASNDQQILAQDADGSYRAIGTADDDYAFGIPANGPNPPITSQLDFTVDSHHDLFETPVDLQSPCPAHDAIAGTVYEHDTPKVCPDVVKLISDSLRSTVPAGSCEPSSSLIVMVNGSNVISYIPKGNWSSQATATGVSVINLEGSGITPTKIPTPHAVNSCAPNPFSGITVCTANSADVYLLKGTSLTKTLTSGGSGVISFSGGGCTNCGVAMDATHDRAVIGLSSAGQPSFQFLDMNSLMLGSTITSPAGKISEDPLIDPVRNLLLSASENGTFEIASLDNVSNPLFFENATGAELDSSAEDCSTGIALAPVEFSSPSRVFIADLTRATFTPGSPAGTWTAPSQMQDLSESSLSAGATGIAVAQGSHTGVITGEFGGDEVTALGLPTTAGSGTPAISDWVSCEIGTVPDGNPWKEGDDPHTVAAYQSPSSGDAIGVMANQGATWVATVDLTRLLDPSIVPRDSAGHACASGTIPPSVRSFIAVP